MKPLELPSTEPELKTFAEAWCDWRGDKLLPNRGEVDLNDIRISLSRMLVFEVRSPAEAVFRLAGTMYREMFGVELTGLNYIDMAPAELRDIRGQRFWAMASQPCGAFVTMQRPGPADDGNVIQTLCLPVRPDGAGAPMQIFCVSAAVQRLDRRETQDIDLVTRVRDMGSFLDIGAGLPDVP